MRGRGPNEAPRDDPFTNVWCPMETFAISMPTMAVSAIYCLWCLYHQARLRHELLRRACLCREQVLRERVACLLWAVATLPEQPGPRPCAPSQPTPLLLSRSHLLLSGQAPPRR
jgi:hypothetical protein